MSEKGRNNQCEREHESRELMVALRGGDLAALDRLIVLNDPILRAYAAKILTKAHEHLLDEVVSNVWLTVYRAPDRFDPGKKSVRAYLFGIAKRQARHLKAPPKSAARNPDLVGDADGEVFVSREEAPEEGAAAHEERDRVQAALEELTPEEREIARGLGEGKSYRSIADDIGKAHASVQKRRPRILDKIAGLFTKRTR
ncbi:MAG TPA: sigma-70 family RNA polymerase sigma factor [Planctomycetota bacterium]|nr:sigma-70 family RNA polymerase sigma factor [Planctomycetota bacterium]